MTGRTHAIAGTSTLWLLAQLPDGVGYRGDFNNIALLAVVAAIGALLPDLDSGKALIKNLSLYGIYPFALPGAIITSLTKHRSFCHSLVGLLIVGGLFSWPLFWYLGWQAGDALLLGYVSHLVLDCLTPVGLPILWPRRTKYHLLPVWLRITTGTPAEGLVFAGCAMLVVGLVIRGFSG